MTALYGLFAIHLHPNGKATQCRYGWRIPQCSLKVLCPGCKVDNKVSFTAIIKFERSLVMTAFTINGYIKAVFNKSAMDGEFRNVR